MQSIRVTDELPRSASLVVIGGGVVGAATAFFAARAGFEPVLIERRPALCTLTTPASTGAFRLQFDNLEELELVRESVELFLHFNDVTGQSTYDLDLRQQGYLFATTDEARAEWQRDLVDKQHGWGQTDIDVLEGAEVRRRFPWIAADVIQARFRAADGFLDPTQLTFGLVAGSGSAVVLKTDVTGFRVRGDRLEAVETSAGPIATDHAVIACGPLSGLLCETIGVTLPIQTVSRHKLVLPNVPEVPQDAPMTIDDDTGAHWRPALDGASVLFTDPATPASPPTDQVPGDPEFVTKVMEPSSPTSVGRLVPFWNDVWTRGDVEWFLQSGQYTNTPDHRPLLGPLGIEGLFLNTGYSGHGIMGSPAGSRHLVDVMTGRIPDDANAFRVDREFEARAFDRL